MTDRSRPVGYKNPPVHTRWQKGCCSPNPGGRPRTTLQEQLGKAVEQVFGDVSPAKLGKDTLWVDAFSAGYIRQVGKALKGDIRAMEVVLGRILELLKAADQHDRKTEDYSASIRRFFELVTNTEDEAQAAYERYKRGEFGSSHQRKRKSAT